MWVLKISDVQTILRLYVRRGIAPTRNCTGVLYASPFHSLSIYPLHPSLSLFLSLSLSLISPSLSYLSLPLYISPSTFLSPSLSLFSLSFSLTYLMDVFVLVVYMKLHFFPVMEIRLFQESGSLLISPEELILHFFLENIFCPYWKYLKEMFCFWERQVNIY